MAKFNTVKSNQINVDGGTSTIDINESVSLYYYYSTGTLSLTAGYDIVLGAGTPSSGAEINVLYKGNTNLTTDTATGKSINFFGVELSDDQAKTDLEITAVYDTYSDPSIPTWRVNIKPNFDYSKYSPISEHNIKNSSITTTKLADSAVTTGKMANLTEGNILIGNNVNIPTAFSMKDDTKFPVGNSTTSVMRAMSGDATMSNLGVVTIANGVITESKLGFTLGDTLLLETELNSGQILELNTVGTTLLSAQGTGKLIIPIEAWGFLDYGTTTYASGGVVSINVGAKSILTIPATSINTASDLVSKFDPTTTIASGSLFNQTLNISIATGNFTTGDGVLKLKILYKILDFN